MKTRHEKTRDALEILERVTGDDPQLQRMIEEATLNAQVAELIYATRRQAGLTQRQLATLIGSTQPVIARLENADYEGHSLSILRRIGDALDLRLELRFVALEDAERDQPSVPRRETRATASSGHPRPASAPPRPTRATGGRPRRGR